MNNVTPEELEQHKTIQEDLIRVGVIQERSHQSGTTRSYMESNIIDAALRKARKAGYSQTMMNALIMEGERDNDAVLKPIKVVSVFACWEDFCVGEGIQPYASYFIKKSNHPDFPSGGNVDDAAFKKAGLEIPKTPSYDQWVKKGRKVVSK